MLHVADMKEGTNDNETWQPLGLPALRLMQRLEEQRPDEERKPEPTKEVDRDTERENFVKVRLREIARFERLYRNNGSRR
jgi:hypothetical protein